MNKNRKKNRETESTAEAKLKGFLDMIAPSVIQFYTDHYICGNTYRSVWALREYPTATDEQAILRHLGEKDGVTLRIYTRQVTPAEEKKIISNAANKNRMKQGNTENLQETVTAASNLQDVTAIISTMHRNREPLLHTAVFLELSAPDMEKLKLLQTEVLTELIRSKLNVDKLLLRQKQGFLCVHPAGRNVFREQFERALPASSVANLFPFNYSGKTDKNGFYIGRDKFGSNVIVDFNQRADDKTNANILILGNSGQGKSYLLKLILTILRESGMKVICLDPEHEYIDLTNNLGGCFVDLMSGEYIINVLEPKTWDENGSPEDTDAPYTFRCSSRLSQHISFLKDFFGTYKNFTDSQIDTIEIMLGKLYEKWNIRDDTDFSKLTPEDYPILSDLYDLMEEEYRHYDAKKKELYTAELLQEICLGLHSMCKGAESKFFNGHTNITDSSFLTFGVKGLLQASRNVKDAMLFNILSYMSNELLTNGHTAASIDEFYLFLTNLTAVEYIRNFMKRVRKKESAVILASQNLEDFNIDGIREYTKPLFSIPTHAFLFNAGNIDARFYIDTLQLEKSEYTAIDAEMFCKQKTAVFLVMPEEDNTKYFIISLILQQLYREILVVADENGGKLDNRVVFYWDEVGTIPKIESAEMMFSASRSRKVSIVPMIQSFAQLNKNYGKEGAEIIIDNCQDTIFGGFAPNSESAEVLSKSLGNKTVMSGSISRGKNDPSQSLQMIQRPLMTPDELKSLPKGNFIVSKTGSHPMRTKLKLFLKWGITFEEPYEIEEKSARKVAYADKREIEEEIIRRYMCCVDEEPESTEQGTASRSGGMLQSQMNEAVAKVRQALRTED